MDFKKLYKKKSPRDLILYSVILAVGIFADQLTKLLAVKYLMHVHSVPIWKDVLHLTYVENRGAAFGMLAGAPWVFNTISIITVIIILGYLYLGHAENRLYAVSLSMIASGGIGNLIDRLSLGYVVDFIDFTLIDFAVFNGADSFVCVGAGLLVLALILDIARESRGGAKK